MSLAILDRALQPIKNKIKLIIGRAILRVVNDGTGIQSVQVSLFKGETRDNIERVQNYGLTSHPPDGSEGVAVFQSGNRAHGFLIVCDNRQFRLKSLAKGEVALYTDEGDKIHFKRGKIIDIETSTLNISATNQVNINTPLVEISSNVHTGGDIDSDSNITAAQNVSAGLNLDAGVQATAPLVQAGSSSMSAGSVSDGTNTLSAFRAEYDSHTHPENGTTTGTPN